MLKIDFKDRMRTCVQAYIDLGWHVLPLLYKGKKPHGKLAPHGSKDATCDLAIIKGWFDSDEDFNIGICAGEGSGLVILDVDPAHDGFESLKKFTVPLTPHARTGGGGRHYYFAHPGGKVRNSAGTIGPGLDLRGHNGYVVAPPSVHQNSEEYRWLLDPRAELAKMPRWCVQKARPSESHTEPQAENEPIPEGQRENTLIKLGGAMRRQSADYDTIYAALSTVNQARCKPPLPDGDLQRLSQSAVGYEPKEDNKIILSNDHADTVARFFEKHSEVKHKYNALDGWSICKDEQYQKVDDEREIEYYLRLFIANCRVKKTVKGKVKTLRPDKNMKTTYFVRNVMTALRDNEDVHLRPGQHSPCWLTGDENVAKYIAVQNGLLDLTNRSKPVLSPFTSDYYTLNYLPVNYEPGAKAEKWLWALGEYFTNDDGTPDNLVPDILHSWIKRFLLRVLMPHRIFALLGHGRSGKGTIARVIRSLLGHRNVTNISISSLTHVHGLAALINKQLGVMWDTQLAGKNTDTSKAVEVMKNISGQDGITINPKGRPLIDLESLPMNLLLVANQLTDLRDPSGALAKRFTFLTTTTSFEGREDPTIEAQIQTELSGILNLVLAAPEGDIPEHPASADLRRDFEELSSPYKAFLNEWCDLNPDNFIMRDVLYAYYHQWAMARGYKYIDALAKFKAAFRYVHPDIKISRPRLKDFEVLTLCNEHNLDQHPTLTFNVLNRPRCFGGIDVRNEHKGQWVVQGGPFRSSSEVDQKLPF